MLSQEIVTTYMIDVTVDLETCSLSPTAAVMSIGAVAWKRYGKEEGVS